MKPVNCSILLILSSLVLSLSSCNTSETRDTGSTTDSLKRVNDSIIHATPFVNSPYSLTYFIDDSIYLLGKHKLNRTVTLIDNARKYTLESETKGYILYTDDFLGEIVLTRISPQPKKMELAGFFATFSGKPDDYRVFDTEVVDDDALLSELDSLLKASGLIDTLLHKQNDVDFNSGMVNDTPEIKRVSVEGNELYIATYKIYDNSTIGPRLAIMSDRSIFPLTGPCSFEDIYIYRFNGNTYIESGSSCCDCGVIGTEIFKVTSNAVNLVYEDYSFSD